MFNTTMAQLFRLFERPRALALASVLATWSIAFTWVVVAAQPTAAPAAAVTAATCDQVGPSTYRITYEATPDAGPVRVYASASAERFDQTSPLSTATTSPVTVSVPNDRGRVYFHMKPHSGPSRVVATRRLPLEGALNFRDLGGYRTADGRHVKWGLVFRTDHLASLTARDYELLGSLGLRLVCDLRTPGERERAPTRWQGKEPETLAVPILSDAQMPVRPGPPGTLSQEEFTRRFELVSNGKPLTLSNSSYKQFVVDYVGSYRQVFRRLVNGDFPTVTHCTAGQDRTGVYSAILLTALGVPRDTVVADYELTNEYRLTDAIVDERRRDWKERFGIDTTPAQARAIQGIRGETLRGTFDIIDQTYGSFDTFRRDALGVSDAELAKLRERLLEP